MTTPTVSGLGGSSHTHLEHSKPLAPGETLLTPTDTLLSFRPADFFQSSLSRGCVGVFRHSWCFACFILFVVTQLVCRPGRVIWLSEVAGSMPLDFQDSFGKLKVK